MITNTNLRSYVTEHGSNDPNSAIANVGAPIFSLLQIIVFLPAFGTQVLTFSLRIYKTHGKCLLAWA
jgi:hypothetical protein